MGYKRWVNRFSTSPLGIRLAKTISARLDPLIYKLTKGRATSTIVPTIPQVSLTTIGRKSGKARTVQLGYIRDGDDFIVVASNFGGQRHPGWSYNLEANPSAELRVGKERIEVRAEPVPDDEKETLWPRLDEAIPQFAVYRRRTDRDIKMYRLRPEPLR